MTDTVERAVAELSDLPSPLRWSDVERRAADSDVLPIHAPTRVGPTRVAIGLSAAAILLVVLMVAWSQRPENQELRTDLAAPTTSPPADLTPSTTAPGSDSAALRTRRSAVSAITDDAYLVWGGESGAAEQDHLDGFAVDLGSGAVSTIPAAPITTVWASQGAWTGTELIVWSAWTGCDTCVPIVPEAAAWNPSTSTWRQVTAPPAAVTASTEGAVWAGDRIVTATSNGVAASYDPRTDEWTMLPPLDVAVWGQASLVWTGAEVVFWATAGFSGPFPAAVGGPIADQGWRWTPGAASWEPLPDLPEGQRTARASAVWTGAELVVWGAATGRDSSNDIGVGAKWRPGDDAWRPMAPSPQPAGSGFQGTQGSQLLGADRATGDVAVRPLALFGSEPDPGQVLLYSPGSDSWRSLEIYIDGWGAPVAVVDGTVFVPDPIAPIAGTL